ICIVLLAMAAAFLGVFIPGKVAGYYVAAFYLSSSARTRPLSDRACRTFYTAGAGLDVATLVAWSMGIMALGYPLANRTDLRLLTCLAVMVVRGGAWAFALQALRNAAVAS